MEEAYHDIVECEQRLIYLKQRYVALKEALPFTLTPKDLRAPE